MMKKLDAENRYYLITTNLGGSSATGIYSEEWYTNASMQRTYTIVKKGSTAHQSAIASRHIKQAVIVPAGSRTF